MMHRLIAGMRPRTGALALALPLMLAPGACGQSPPADGIPDRPPCSGAVVIIADGERVACDVTPPQVMMVTGMTAADCADSGGVALTNRIGDPFCWDIDY